MNGAATIGVIGQFEAGSSLAHAINVVKTAGGFARLGHRVIVCCRAPQNGASVQRVACDYGEPSLEWRFEPRGAIETGSDLGREFARWAVGVCTAERCEIVYARHFLGALAAARTRVKAILETHAHAGEPNALLEECLRNLGPYKKDQIASLVTISMILKEDYLRRGADSGRVHVVPDGVDLDLFGAVQAECRGPARPRSRPVAMYAGHLYDYKGIPTILESARLMPDVDFVLLGGLPEDQARVRSQISAESIPNVRLMGAIPHSEVAARLKEADVLLLPPSGKHPSARWTSPVKLGEYLASGRAIVASDIPALRDLVEPPSVRWFRPDDAYSLAESIREALTETPQERTSREVCAAEWAHRYSYVERARRILASVLSDENRIEHGLGENQRRVA